MKNAAGTNIEALYHLVNNNVEAIEFKIKRHIDGIFDIPLRNITLKKNILIGGIIRKRTVIIPNGDDVIRAGDSVIIISRDYHFSDITDILEE